MSKADKAGEPSMDEILASIRKIIAEEPVGARKAAPVEAPGPAASATRAEVPQKVTLDDVLGLADGAPRTRPTAAADAKARSDVPAWLFPSPAQAEPTPDKPAATREPSKPFFSAPSPSAAAGPSVPGDLGSIIPKRPADAAVDLPGAVPAERRPQSGRVPEWLARPAAAAPQAAPLPSQPLPPPAEPTRVPPREPLVPVAAAPAGATEAAGASDNARAATATPAAAAVVKPAPVPQSPAAAETRPSDAKPGPANAVEPPASKPAPAPSSAEADAKKPAAAAQPSVAAPAAQAAAPVANSAAAVPIAPAAPSGAANAAEVAKPAHTNGPALPPVAAAPAASPALAQPPVAPAIQPVVAAAVPVKAVAEAPVPVQKPAALAERPKTAKPAAAADLVPTMPQMPAVRTLEDTVVDLLRPMIRRWLDDNMPRMVEKALRIELAQSVNPRLDPARPEPPKH